MIDHEDFFHRTLSLISKLKTYLIIHEVPLTAHDY
jgi:hypothetical protein